MGDHQETPFRCPETLEACYHQERQLKEDIASIDRQLFDTTRRARFPTEAEYTAWRKNTTTVKRAKEEYLQILRPHIEILRTARRAQNAAARVAEREKAREARLRIVEQDAARAPELQKERETRLRRDEVKAEIERQRTTRRLANLA